MAEEKISQKLILLPGEHSALSTPAYIMALKILYLEIIGQSKCKGRTDKNKVFITRQLRILLNYNFTRSRQNISLTLKRVLTIDHKFY